MQGRQTGECAKLLTKASVEFEVCSPTKSEVGHDCAVKQLSE